MHGTCALRWLLIAACCAVSATVAPAQPAKPLAKGAASLFGVTEITVVYPAGPEANRVSAERRAAFLRSVHGQRVEVVADDAVSPEQRDGNLLLLGWDNRLLPTEEGRRPIVAEADTHVFLGELRIGPGEDLLFAWVSPHNPQRLMAFWSRLDPELDRLMSLPQVGSDWAVYRDFLILGQGMFVEDDGWPPQRNPFGERPIAEPAAMSVGPSSAHYRLHADPMLPETEARSVLAAREAAWSHVTQALGGAPEELRIELFVYRDRAQMRERSGVRDLALFSIPARGELHMIKQLALVDNPHEDFHLVAREMLGPAPVSAMFEGLAVALDPGADDTALAVYAAGLREQGGVPSVAELLDEERTREMMRQGTGLAAAGLFVRWLREKTDDETFRRLYTLPSGKPGDVAQLLEITTPAMEQGFAAWMAEQAESGQGAYVHSKALDEARWLGSRGDREGEFAALRKALELRPDDAETLYMMSMAQLRRSEVEAAETTLRRLVEVTSGDKGSSGHVLGLYQLGLTLDVRGKPDEALELFESLLALPDLRDSHRRAREAIERLRDREGGD